MLPRNKTRARRPPKRRGSRAGLPAQECAVLRPTGVVGLFFHLRSSVFICGSNAFRPGPIRLLRADHRISNRNIPRLEPRVTRCKQREATHSNRNKTGLCNIRLSAPLPRARRAAFDACPRISNRQIPRLTRRATVCKQTAAVASNRQKTRLFNDHFSGVGRHA
jgi:hypothetical protein